MTMPTDILSRKPGRDDKGRFAKRNKFGHGNPFARRVAALRSVLLEEVDDAKFRRMVKDLVEMALDKDLAAMKLVFQYVLGRPPEAVNPDDLDHLEWQQLKRDCVSVGEMTRVANTDSLPAEVAGDFVKAMLPFNGTNARAACGQALRTGDPYGDGDIAANEEEETPEETPAPAAVEEESELEALLKIAFPTVTTREQRTERAANEGQPKPMTRPNQGKKKKRRGKGRK